ncbi:LysR family transcriptional regulator [Cupriavidus sp. D39]|uniref:LysR family transcriptional regulator n=1 Tax=Cupriavidus sp. D39 TaxID=2997877 RepID=UPI002D1E3AB5|nr:LysR family transcriptional regulator [Cupriavidus sp. D39]
MEALEALDAVDRYGTFATAAESLHKVPSSISYLISRLEEELNVLLFDRSGQRAKLTSTGRAVLEDGRRLLRSASELERRAQSIEIGWESELRIAVDVILPFRALVPHVTDFYRAGHPTRLSFSHEVLGGTWDALLSGRVNMVIGALGDPPNVSGFSACPIGQIQTAFAVAPDHPLAMAPLPLTRSASQRIESSKYTIHRGANLLERWAPWKIRNESLCRVFRQNWKHNLLG